MNQQPPTPWLPTTRDRDLAQLDCASRDEGGIEDRWISAFIKRLNSAIGNIGRKK
jgi:hypothetical protein